MREYAKEISCDGIDFTFTRKKIKNINIRITSDGEVKVSAPVRMSEDRVIQFVRSRKGWIEKNLEKIGDVKDKPVRRYESGEKIRLFGRDYTLEVLPGSSYKMVHSGDKVIMYARRGSTVQGRDNFTKKWYKEMLSNQLQGSVAYWEGVTGLKCSNWHIRDMKSRWGSCNTRTRELCFNLQLVSVDSSLVDYVVLHELAHIRYPNHGKGFWDFVETYMPDRKERRKALNSFTKLYRYDD